MDNSKLPDDAVFVAVNAKNVGEPMVIVCPAVKFADD